MTAAGATHSKVPTGKASDLEELIRDATAEIKSP